MDKHDASTGIRSTRASVAVVAIGGPSCSGKSTLVEALRACWGPEYTAVLPIDAYYRDHAHLPMEERMKCNFDAPETIDWALLTDQLAEIIAGNAIERPVYDYTTHTRAKERIRLEPRPILILEGLFALWPDALRRLAAARVYVDLPAERCLARRIVRDRAERGRSEAQVREQFERFVRPMAKQYVLPTRACADLVVPGDGPVERSVKRVAMLLDTALAASWSGPRPWRRVPDGQRRALR